MWLLCVTLPIWVFDLAEDLVPTGAGGQWEYGVPGAGPTASEGAWATRLSSNYLHNGSDQLEFTVPSLEGVTRPILLFHHWYSVLEEDAGWFEVDQGDGFERVDPVFAYPHEDGFVGVSEGWEQTAIDLTGYPDESRVRLVFHSDETLADLGWYLDGVVLWDGDPVAPWIEPVTVPMDVEDVEGPYPVVFRIEDDREVTSVDIHWKGFQEQEFQILPMSFGDGVWSAQIPGQVADTTVVWFVEASDGENIARWPTEGDSVFRVFLGAPSALTRLDDARVAQSVSLTWTPPVSVHEVLEYEVWQEGYAPHRVWGPPAVLPLVRTSGGPPVVKVRAVYAQGVGDQSESLEVNVEVPSLSGVTPHVLWPTERVNLSIHGQSLYALEQATEISLGEGVVVESLTVRDVDTVDVRVSVEEDASEGPRALVLDGAQGHFVFSDAIQVGDSSTYPRGVTLGSDHIAQGSDERIEIHFAQPLVGEVQVVGDEDLYVGHVEVASTNMAWARVSADPAARVGTHALQVTDGIRWWALDVQVIEVTYLTTAGCHVVARSPNRRTAGWVWWLGLIVGLSGFRARRSRPRR